MSGVLIVGRPKRSNSDEPQKTLLSLKGRTEWIEWLRRYAEHVGLPLSSTIDVALREQAKREGFKEPMPKRF